MVLRLEDLRGAIVIAPQAMDLARFLGIITVSVPGGPREAAAFIRLLNDRLQNLAFVYHSRMPRPNLNKSISVSGLVILECVLVGSACLAQVEPVPTSHRVIPNLAALAVLTAAADRFTPGSKSLQQVSAGALPSLSRVQAKTSSEQFVLASVESGREGDLVAVKDKNLSATFIDTLLFRTAAAAVPGKIITIKNATITGSIDVPFGSPAVSSMIVFDQCEFSGPVNFNNGRFDQSLVFRNSIFDQGFYLTSAQVKGDVLVENSIFKGNSTISMELARVEGVVSLLDAQVQHVHSPGLIARSFTFKIPSGFRVEEIILMESETDLTEIYATSPDEISVGTLNLRKARVKDDVIVRNIGVAELTAVNLQSSGITEFAPLLHVVDRLDLTDAQLGIFEWVMPKAMLWPKQIPISGLTFQDLDVSQDGGESDSYNLLFLLLANSSETAYTTYEAALRRLGRLSEADEVYKSMRAKRRQEAFANGRQDHSQLFNALVFVAVDWLQGIFLGYGRFPLPPTLWSLAIVMLGSRLFAKSRMQIAPKSEVELDSYSRFWYSLELFLPVVDLGVAKGFRPKHQNRKLLAYARLHQLAGWVLVPVSLAALTGAIK